VECAASNASSPALAHRSLASPLALGSSDIMKERASANVRTIRRPTTIGGMIRRDQSAIERLADCGANRVHRHSAGPLERRQRGSRRRLLNLLSDHAKGRSVYLDQFLSLFQFFAHTGDIGTRLCQIYFIRSRLVDSACGDVRSGGGFDHIIEKFPAPEVAQVSHRVSCYWLMLSIRQTQLVTNCTGRPDGKGA